MIAQVEKSPLPAPRTPRLLDQVHAAMRARHLSFRTAKAYAGWIRRFVFFSGKRHPRDMGEPEVTKFLSHLAVKGRVSTSTQNQVVKKMILRVVFPQYRSSVSQLGQMDKLTPVAT